MSTTPAVRYLLVEAPGSQWQKFYEVHVDGKPIGYVGTQLVTFERPLSRTSRIVASRTRSPRWFTHALVSTTPQSRRFRTGQTWYESRKWAAERLVRDWNDALPENRRINRTLIGEAIKESRNFKKSEIPGIEWVVRTPNWCWIGPDGWEIHRNNQHDRTEYMIFKGLTPVDTRGTIVDAKSAAEALILESRR